MSTAGLPLLFVALLAVLSALAPRPPKFRSFRERMRPKG
jgi:hypothetical protein